MPWHVKKNENLGFIEIVYTGALTKKDSDDSTAMALSLATGEGPHLFLSDLSGAHLKLSVNDLYTIPHQWEAARAGRNNSLAIIAPQKTVSPEDSQFFQDVIYNRGWDVRLFETRQAAIDWLTQNSPPTTHG